MDYVSKTQGISRDQLKKMLDESKIDGGDLVKTLAQQMKEEFLETMGPQLKEEGKKEDAKRMLKKGFDIDTIIDITGLEKTEIEKLIPEI